MANFNWLFSIKNRSYYLVILLGLLQDASTGISSVSIQYLYKDDFLLSPSDATFMDSLSSIPWIIKPIWGFISDSFPLMGYRRKSYLILFSCLQIFLWFLLMASIKNIYIGVFCLIALSLASAFINVICEALIVEITQNVSKNKSEVEKQKEASFNVSSFVGSRYMGSLITVYLGGLLLEKVNNTITFILSAIFSLLSGLASCFISEIRGSKNQILAKDSPEKSQLQNYSQFSEAIKTPESQSLKVSVCLLIRFLSQKRVFYPILFLFLLTTRPSSNRAIFYFYTNVLDFQPDFIGILSLLQSFGSILGIFIYNRYFKLMSYKKFFISTTIVYVILDLSQIILISRINKSFGIPDKLFCFIDSLMTDFMLELNLFPVLIIACRLSPKNMEGTMYALMMSIYNFSSIIGNQMGAGLMIFLGITENNFDNLYLLIILTNVWVVFVLPSMLCADFDSAQQVAEQHDQGSNVKKEKNDGKSMALEFSSDIVNIMPKNEYFQMQEPSEVKI